MDEQEINLPVKVYLRDRSIDSVRKAEFSRLDGLVYLDHAGSTLYPKSVLTSFHDDLTSNVYGNPHGSSESSRLTIDTVEQTRVRVLHHFHVTPDDYTVIFTSGCTSALKVVADTFDFSGAATCLEKEGNNAASSGGCFAYLEDNHTSVIGLREIAKSRDAHVICVPVQFEDGKVKDPCAAPESLKPIYSSANETKTDSSGNCLFAFPAQSNFSGFKYPLDWVDKLQGLESAFSKATGCKQTFILLDAAALVSTSDLDLKKCRPDFVTLSFYKIFGIPTGLGALLVRNDRIDLLQKTYFGGGTVHVAIATEDYHVKNKNMTDRFEDGTIAFLDIIALKHGFESIQKIAGTISNVCEQTFHLARYIHHSLKAMRHKNGRPVAELYQETDFEDIKTQGPVVNFNILSQDGEYIGFSEIEKLATVYNIQFRVGCFCNLGACHRLLEIPAQKAKEHFRAGHVCGDDVDLIDGKPTGSIRVSLGYMSTLDDAQQFIDFIRQCFVEYFSQHPSASMQGLRRYSEGLVKHRLTSQTSTENLGLTDATGRRRRLSSQTSCESSSPKKIGKVKLTHIFIYPVKSCAAVQLESCEIGPRGFLYDRQWMVVTETGNCLNQKREPLMCRIQPIIDRKKGRLILQYPGMEDFSVPLDHNASGGKQLDVCDSRVCTDRIRGLDCGDGVAGWLQRALDKPGLRLVSQADMDPFHHNKRDKLSLANEAQYLLINSASVKFLSRKLREHTTEDNPFADAEKLLNQFRANLVISASEPYVEETWSQIIIGTQTFQVERRCLRCQMICVDQQSGERSSDPLMSLLTSRNRRAAFGMLLNHVSDVAGSSSSGGAQSSPSRITQGDEVCITAQK